MVRTHIVVHHSATKDSGTVSWGAIERYHRETMGWRDVGYHAGVELVNGEPYALVGRPVTQEAAACRQANMNWVGLHVCIVGDFDVAPPDHEVLRVAMVRIIKPWMLQYGIQPLNVIGHRDAGLLEGFDWKRGQYKTCPGRLFDMDALRRLAR